MHQPMNRWVVFLAAGAVQAFEDTIAEKYNTRETDNQSVHQNTSQNTKIPTRPGPGRDTTLT